jgi:hypothetical protein
VKEILDTFLTILKLQTFKIYVELEIFRAVTMKHAVSEERVASIFRAEKIREREDGGDTFHRIVSS